MEQSKPNTAVKFLLNNLWKQTSKSWWMVVRTAKEIEKQNLQEAWNEALASQSGHEGVGKQITFEDYYIETYGNQ